MPQIIWSVMAIALMAVMATTAAIYINPIQLAASTEAKRLSEGFSEISGIVGQFQKIEGRIPFRDTEFIPGMMLYPDSPFPEKSAAWSYVNEAEDSNGPAYICVEGSATMPTYMALQRISSNYSPQAYFIGLDCGVTANEALSIPDSTPGRMAATLWLTRY